jgi:hypothetical protein
MIYLQGYIKTTFDKLKIAFGDPIIHSNKSIAEWIIKIDNLDYSIHIYNWNTNTIPIEEYEWHVSGKNQTDIEIIKNKIT